MKTEAGRALRADCPVWTVNQLRHTRATEIERMFGGDPKVVQVMLGHRNLETQKYYVLEDESRAFEAAAQLG